MIVHLKEKNEPKKQIINDDNGSDSDVFNYNNNTNNKGIIPRKCLQQNKGKLI